MEYATPGKSSLRNELMRESSDIDVKEDSSVKVEGEEMEVEIKQKSED